MAMRSPWSRRVLRRAIPRRFRVFILLGRRQYCSISDRMREGPSSWRRADPSLPEERLQANHDVEEIRPNVRVARDTARGAVFRSPGGDWPLESAAASRGIGLCRQMTRARLSGVISQGRRSAKVKRTERLKRSVPSAFPFWALRTYNGGMARGW